VPGRSSRFAALAAAAFAAGSLAASGGADPTVSQLRARNAALGGRAHAALLDLYSLDTRLGAARARLASLSAQAATVRRQRAEVRLRLRIARAALRISQRQLAEHLRALYEQGDTDTLSVVLGASTLDEAIEGLDSINRTATLSRHVIDQTTRAQRLLLRLGSSLARRDAQVEALAAQAERETTSLAAARAERSAYVARLSAQRTLNARTISTLEQTAQAAQQKSQALAAVQPPAAAPASGTPAPAPPAAPAAPEGGHTLTVSSTGYSLPGHTATGLPVGWGIVAVDPSVIPLGTHMTIPGYGEGVAADTGGAVRGATIDLWFPTVAQARAWGRRTVTITLH
jgi:cystine transport system substrate-binding protein